MNQQKIDAYAKKYNIDAEALQSCFEDCKALIDQRLADHPSCRQAHVATLVMAAHIGALAQSQGHPLLAQLILVELGNDVFDLAFAEELRDD